SFRQPSLLAPSRIISVFASLECRRARPVSSERSGRTGEGQLHTVLRVPADREPFGALAAKVRIMSLSSHHTLVSVWAHPDDEAYLSANLMAEFCRRGDRVVVITATLGKHGTSDPQTWPPARLAAHRERELRAALGAVGVDELHLLKFEDSNCAS